MTKIEQNPNSDEVVSPEKAAYIAFLKALGARIRMLRKQRGWSWRDMVVIHEFHLSKWQSYESGRYGVSMPSLLRISRLFGMSVSDLLKGLDEQVTPEASGSVDEFSGSGIRSKRAAELSTKPKR